MRESREKYDEPLERLVVVEFFLTLHTNITKFLLFMNNCAPYSETVTTTVVYLAVFLDSNDTAQNLTSTFSFSIICNRGYQHFPDRGPDQRLFVDSRAKRLKIRTT
jgi:hypothetical protein